ncbi:MAG: hypothetical protein ABEJ25_02655 [Candidatus Bipolaricaulia bacterium]
MNVQKRKLGRTLILVLAVTFLTVSCFASPVLAQEEESETVGMDVISNLIELIGTSEEVDKETVINALEGLSEDVIAKLDEKGVPGETLGNFKEEFSSALTLFQEGLVTRSRFANMASDSVGRLGRDTAENLPVELLKENGVNTEAIQQLKEGTENYSGPEVAEIARSIAGKGEKDEEEEEGEEKGEEEREKAEEKKEEAKAKGEEERAEGQQKGEEERENSGAEDRDEGEEGRSERDEEEEEKGESEGKDKSGNDNADRP